MAVQLKGRTAAHVQLARETRKARLAVDTGEDVEGELFWSLDNDVLAGGIPADHVVVLGTFKKTTAGR